VKSDLVQDMIVALLATHAVLSPVQVTNIVMREFQSVGWLQANVAIGVLVDQGVVEVAGESHLDRQLRLAVI
jgi:hypothetical protein